MAAQAQKHVTHNEALRSIDTIAQLSVIDRDLTAPTVSPLDGDRFIVAASASGEWLGKDGQIAAYQDNAWVFYEPLEGWLCWVADEETLLVFVDTVWSALPNGINSVNPTPLLGVNATADLTNRLSINSPASLFNHEGSMATNKK